MHKKGLRRSVLPLRESWGLWLGWLQEIKKILKSKTNGTLATILSLCGFMGLSQNKSKNPFCILIQLEKYGCIWREGYVRKMGLPSIDLIKVYMKQNKMVDL